MKYQITLGHFLKIGSLALVGSMLGDFAFAMKKDTLNDKKDIELLELLLAFNDQKVASIMDDASIFQEKVHTSYRKIAQSIAVVSASVCNVDSKFYRDRALIAYLRHSADVLLDGQYEDGTLDSGGNRQSPPDTAFVLEHICSAMTVLKKDAFGALQLVRNTLKKFITSAGKAMLTGGVHTPNHRWVICAALANIYTLYPDIKYLERIEEWLSEGVYTNEDGHYLERSANYSAVINKALITISKVLNKPKLLESVLKNLITFCYYTELNGDVVSIDSRRQDQLRPSTITKFYLQYRYMALRTQNPLLVYMTKQIENFSDFKSVILSNSLIEFMVDAELDKQLPVSSLVLKDYEKIFPLSGLCRIKRNNTTMTIFGGTDKPVEIVSGKSSNPNFLTYRKGNAMLKHMRISSSFFRMGYFRGDGLVKKDASYSLSEIKEAYYYQPLEKKFQKPDGDYKLSESHDKRFWNKMDFDSRPKSNIKKQITTINITEDNGTLDIDFKVDGPPNVEVTIEMCFGKGGKIIGGTTVNEESKILESGFAEYKVGNDSIKFGPGNTGHQRVTRLESEQYGYHNGSLRTEGVYIYITGHTPFIHKMTLG